jgi:hypothetical protein
MTNAKTKIKTSDGQGLTRGPLSVAHFSGININTSTHLSQNTKFHGSTLTGASLASTP